MRSMPPDSPALHRLRRREVTRRSDSAFCQITLDTCGRCGDCRGRRQSAPASEHIHTSGRRPARRHGPVRLPVRKRRVDRLVPRPATTHRRRQVSKRVQSRDCLARGLADVSVRRGRGSLILHPTHPSTWTHPTHPLYSKANWSIGIALWCDTVRDILCLVIFSRKLLLTFDVFVNLIMRDDR